MAIKYAVATGNWSNTSTWNGGTLPTSADDVYANLFTVTIDTSPTVLSISNGTTTGVTTAGGSFVPTNGITLTCTATNGIVSSNASCFISSLTTGQSCTIVGNVTNPGGAAGSVWNTSSGTINVNGIITGSSVNGNNCYGLRNQSTGTINVTGNLVGGINTGYAVYNEASGTINLNAGTATGGSNSAAGIYNAATGTINIIGNLLGGVAAAGCFNLGAGVVNVTGTITSSNGAAGMSSASATATITLSGPFITSINGANPVYAIRWFWQNASPPATYYQIRSANLSVIRPLYTADSVGGNPATSNVRLGTVYGPSSELTGTMAVPPTGSVALGVPVDNTTGTAIQSRPVDFWNYPISGITTSGSIGERLKSVATVNTVSHQISDAFSAK